MPTVRRPRQAWEEKPGTPVVLWDESEVSQRVIEQLTAAKIRFKKVPASVHDKRAFQIPAILSVFGFMEGLDAAERFIERQRLANGRRRR